MAGTGIGIQRGLHSPMNTEPEACAVPPQVRDSISEMPVSPAARFMNGPYLLAALPELRRMPEVAEAVETMPEVVVLPVVPAELV